MNCLVNTRLFLVNARLLITWDTAFYAIIYVVYVKLLMIERLFQKNRFYSDRILLLFGVVLLFFLLLFSVILFFFDHITASEKMSSITNTFI